MELGVIRVRFTGDTSNLDRAFDSSEKKAKGFARSVGASDVQLGADTSSLESGIKKAKSSLGGYKTEANSVGKVQLEADASGVERGAAQAAGALGKVRSAFAEVRSAAGRGVQFAVDATSSGFDRAKSAIADVRGDASRGATMEVDANTAGLDEAKGQILELGKLAGAVAIGGVLGDAGGGLVENLNAATTGAGRLTAQLGTTQATTGELGKVAETVFKGNWGESLEETQNAVGMVSQRLGGLKGNGTASLGALTEKAFILRDAFGYDLEESIESARIMSQNFGISGKKAFDLITAGSQRGANSAGDLTDSLREYSPFMAELGITAEQQMGMYTRAMQAGAWNTDRVGDAIKEFSVRAVDGTDTTAQGFKLAGLSADEMSRKIAAGGPQAQKAFQQTVGAILSIEDPIKREEAGVALFGTMWEDLGPKVIGAMAEGGKGLENFGGSTKRAGDALSDNLGAKIGSISRQVQTFAGNALNTAINKVGEFGSKLRSMSQEGGGGGAFGGLLRSAMDLRAKIMPEMQKAFSGIGKVFTDTFARLGPMVRPALNDLAAGFKALQPAVKPVAAFVGGVLKGAFQSIVPLVGTILVGALRIGAFAFRQIATVAGSVGKKLEPFTPLISKIGQVVGFVFGTVIFGAIGGALKIIGQLASRIPYLGKVAGPALRLLGGAFSGAAKIAQGAFNLIGGTIARVGSAIGSRLGFIRNAFSTAWQWITQRTAGLRSSLSNAFSSIGSLISSRWTAAVSRVRNITGSAWQWLTARTTQLGTTLRNVFSTIGGFVASRWAAGVGRIRSITGAAWGWLTTRTTALGNSLRSVFSTIGSFIAQRWTSAVQRVRSIASSAWSWVTQRTTQLGTSLRGVFTQLGQFITSRWAAMTTGVRTRAQQMWTQVTGMFTSARARLGSIVTGLRTFVTNAFQQLGRSVVQRVTEMWSQGRSLFTRLKDSGLQIFTSLRTGVTSRVRELGSNLKESFTNQFNNARDIYTNLRNRVGELFTAAKDRAIKAIHTLGRNLGEAFENQVNRARDFGESIKRTLGSKFGAAVNRVRGWLGNLMYAVGNVLEAVGAEDMSKKADSLGDQLKQPQQLAKGGVTSGGPQMMHRGGISIGADGVEIGDQGGVGTGKKIVAITNEAGPEAVIPLDKETRQGTQALGAAAQSRGLTLVPKSPDHYGGHFHGPPSALEKSAIRGVRTMAEGGVSGKNWTDNINNYPTSRGGFPWLGHVAQVANLVAKRIGSDPSTYPGHSPTQEQAIDFMQANRANEPGDTIADFLWGNANALGLQYEIWKQRIRGAYAGNSWQGMADRGSDTQNHFDHVHGSFNRSPGSGEVSSNATYQGGGAGGGGFDVLGAIADAFKKVGDFPKLNLGMVGEGIAALGPMLLKKAKDFLVDKATELMGSVTDAGRGLWGKITGGGTPAQNVELGRKMQEQMGVRGSFSSLENLWHKESGWNQYAENASSGAYGIPQALPPTKLPAEGQKSGGSKPGPQIGWGLDYIKGRYGSTDAAWQHSQANNWYKLGGRIPGIKGDPKVIGAHAGEIVLPQGIADNFELFTEELHMLRRSGQLNGTLGGSAGAGASVNQQQVVEAIHQVVSVMQQDQAVTRSQRIENVEEVASTIAAVMPMVTESPAFKRAMSKAIAGSMNSMAETIRSSRGG